MNTPQEEKLLRLFRQYLRAERIYTLRMVKRVKTSTTIDFEKAMLAREQRISFSRSIAKRRKKRLNDFIITQAYNQIQLAKPKGIQ